MAGLVPKILISDEWSEVGVRSSDLIGDPLESALLVQEFRVLADDYILTFSDVVPGVSATITVTASTPNPYTGGSQSIGLDATTEYLDIIPGVSLIFSDNVGFTNSWSITLTIGLPHGVKNSFPPEAGVPEQYLVQVVNTGLAAGADCKARLLPALKAVKKTGVIFADGSPFVELGVMKTTDGVVSPYLFEASNVAGSGAAKEMDLELDGASFEVLNLTSQATTSSVELNVVDWYRVTDGDLAGWEFILSEETVNGDQENALVFDPDFLELSPYDAGAPGDWSQDDALLTQDGQLDGVINASGEAYFFFRITVGEFSNKLSNPYPCCIAIEGSALSAANWSE